MVYTAAGRHWPAVFLRSDGSSGRRPCVFAPVTPAEATAAGLGPRGTRLPEEEPSSANTDVADRLYPVDAVPAGLADLVRLSGLPAADAPVDVGEDERDGDKRRVPRDEAAPDANLPQDVSSDDVPLAAGYVVPRVSHPFDPGVVHRIGLQFPQDSRL